VNTPIDEYEHDDRSGGDRFRDWIWEVLRTWGPAILTVLLIRSMVAEPFRIPSGSMVPTLAIGDHILVTKYSYGLRLPLTRIPITELQAPDRGDVVVFVFPGSDDTSTEYWFDLPVQPFKTYDYVKRVVGLPGESIEVRDNVVFLNGVAQTRSHVSKFDFVDDRCRSIPTRLFDEDLDGLTHSVLNATRYGLRMGDYGPTTVPDGHVFVMGDNRDHSADSRVWGMVPFRNIKGKARFIWLSYDQCSPGVPLLGDVRGERFGIPVN
jgi:signal peptidase I